MKLALFLFLSLWSMVGWGFLGVKSSHTLIAKFEKPVSKSWLGKFFQFGSLQRTASEIRPET